MVKIIKNFDRKDCIHYETREIPSCCGRSARRGLCVIDDKQRTCSTKMRWCAYEKKKEEENDVHPT